jgi:multiple sugar transport system permease protein
VGKQYACWLTLPSVRGRAKNVHDSRPEIERRHVHRGQPGSKPAIQSIIVEATETLTGQRIAIAWLSDPTLALVAVMIADIWQWTPLMLLILLAGLVGVPDDQIKAATLLGANAWQRFVTIVLPNMKTIIIIALAIRVIENFKIFDTLYIMTGGGPGVATETISVYIYKVTIQDLLWSYVAAIALTILIVLSILAVVAMKRMASARDAEA